MKSFNWDEIKSQNLVVFENKVYDLNKFNFKHKGGSFLNALAGKNITFHLYNAHRTNEKYHGILANYKVGDLAHSQITKEDQDFTELLKSYEDRGYFSYKAIWFFFDFLKILTPFALGLYFSQSFPVFSVALFSFHVLLVCWLVHDIAHNSVFKIEKNSRFFTGLLSLLFTGTYAVEYQYIVHRIHHGFTNVLNLDGALSTRPITWHKSQESHLSQRLKRWRTFLWLVPVLLSVFPAVFLLGIFMNLNPKKWWVLALLGLRWWFFISVLFQGQWMLAVLPVIIGGYILGLISSLNHFHKKIDTQLNNSFLAAVAYSTQNIGKSNWFFTEIFGGLNYHIEHHLFTTMPRHNYPKVASDIRQLFSRYHLPYDECGKREAFKKFFAVLKGF